MTPRRVRRRCLALRFFCEPIAGAWSALDCTMRTSLLSLLTGSLALGACGARTTDTTTDASADVALPTQPATASYSQTCSVDADCVLVTVSMSCASADCGCLGGAISKGDSAKYQRDADAWKAVCLSAVAQQPCAIFCSGTKAFCSAGSCGVRFCDDLACAPDAGVDAPSEPTNACGPGTASGIACSSNGTTCLSGTRHCACAPKDSPASETVWECERENPPECPTSPPAIGTSCPASFISCEYGLCSQHAKVGRACSGAWSNWDPGCPT